MAPAARMGSAVLEVLAARMASAGAITHLAVPQVQVVAVAGPGAREVVAVAGPGAREAVDGVVRAALVVPVVLAADAVAGQSRPMVGGSLATASDEAEAHNGA